MFNLNLYFLFVVVEKKEESEALLNDLIPPIVEEIPPLIIKNADFPQNETKIEANKIQEQTTITMTAAAPQAISVKEAK